MGKKLLKKMLRKKYLALRKELAKGYVESASNEICAKLVSTPQFKKAQNILFYYPVKNEVNCLPAMQKAFLAGKRVFLPKVRGWDFNIVEVKSFAALAELEKGELGIPEPTGEKTPLEKIGLVVVPAVAFDLQGHRIGYGGGYYDELLKRKKASVAVAIGLCYGKTLLKKIPFQEHDQRVDYIACENKVIGAKRRNKLS